MVPTSDSELTGWSKVSVVLWRMSLHERLCTTTLLAPFQARMHDARLGSSVHRRRQQSANKSRKVRFNTFCEQADSNRRWPK